jgi:hypothetical protein
MQHVFLIFPYLVNRSNMEPVYIYTDYSKVSKDYENVFISRKVMSDIAVPKNVIKHNEN